MQKESQNRNNYKNMFLVKYKRIPWDSVSAWFCFTAFIILPYQSPKVPWDDIMFLKKRRTPKENSSVIKKIDFHLKPYFKSNCFYKIEWHKETQSHL